MTNWRTAWSVGLAGCAALAVAATAAERTAQRAGAYYPAVGSLEGGQQVEAGEAAGGWVAVRAGEAAGWVAASVFEAPRSGVDYAGMLAESGGISISSVDIAAATKGAFAARYEERHGADWAAVEWADGIAVPAGVLTVLRQGLSPAPGYGAPAGLPRRPFDNNIVLSLDAEKLLGRALLGHLAADGIVTNLDLANYVNAVGALVGARTERYDLPYRVVVTRDSALNGFGLPGGYIVLSGGYLAAMRDEAELACVIGHEMAHVSLFHGLREFSKRAPQRRRDAAFAELDAISGENTLADVEADLNRLADTASLKIMGGRARTDELEADLFGAAYAAAAGYDPEAMVDLLERVGASGEEDRFRHHPELSARLEALREGIRRYGLKRPGQKRMATRFGIMTGHNVPAPAGAGS